MDISSALPTVEELTLKLRDIRDYAARNRTDLTDPRTGEVSTIDVRLQVHDGTWRLWDGDSQYDTDHRGFWAASAVAGDDTYLVLKDMAVALIEEAQDDAAQCDDEESEEG